MRPIILRAINALLKKRGIKAEFLGPDLRVAIPNVKIQVRNNYVRIMLVVPLELMKYQEKAIKLTLPPEIDIEVSRVYLADPNFIDLLVEAIVNAKPQRYKP